MEVASGIDPTGMPRKPRCAKDRASLSASPLTAAMTSPSRTPALCAGPPAYTSATVRREHRASSIAHAKLIGDLSGD
jgi:hypothetical protein